jgi:hypothetical protein
MTHAIRVGKLSGEGLFFLGQVLQRRLSEIEVGLTFFSPTLRWWCQQAVIVVGWCGNHRDRAAATQWSIYTCCRLHGAVVFTVVAILSAVFPSPVLLNLGLMMCEQPEIQQ